jgi:hypothetical protein
VILKCRVPELFVSLEQLVDHMLNLLNLMRFRRLRCVFW